MTNQAVYSQIREISRRSLACQYKNTKIQWQYSCLGKTNNSIVWMPSHTWQAIYCIDDNFTVEECCVLSGLDFEGADSSIVRYCLSNYFFRGHRVTVNMTCNGSSFAVKSRTLKRMPIPLFGRLVRCSAHGHSFCETTVYLLFNSLVWGSLRLCIPARLPNWLTQLYT